MRSIYNQLNKKLSSLVSDESVFWHSIGFMVLLPLILKLFGLGRHDIYLAFNQAALFFLAMIVVSALTNIRPKGKREPLTSASSTFCQRNPTVGRMLSWLVGISLITFLGLTVSVWLTDDHDLLRNLFFVIATVQFVTAMLIVLLVTEPPSIQGAPLIQLKVVKFNTPVSAYAPPRPSTPFIPPRSRATV